jgi:hypothetical protein
MFKYLNVKRGEKSFQKKGKERMFLIGHFPIIKKKKDDFGIHMFILEMEVQHS